MTVLRRGYVPVEPNADGFDDKLKAQLTKQDAGGKAGKQLGGQLNRALKKVNLDPIDINADPKAALAKIKETEARLKELGRDAATVEVKVQTEKALSQLGRFKKQLGEVGDGQGEPAARGFISGFASKLTPKLVESFSGSMSAAAAPALLAIAPTLSAGIAGAVVGAAGVGGVIGGITLAARDERVKAAGKALGGTLLVELQRRSSDFVPAVLGAVGQVRQGFVELGPDLDRIFKSSRFVAPLTDGLLKGVRGFVKGFADAIDQADPVIASLSSAVSQIGIATGDLFSGMSRDATQGAGAIDQLTFAVTNLISATGGIVHVGASIGSVGDGIDKIADKTRYYIEDNGILADGLRQLGVNLDLTADGFKHGSAEAEAYRRATLGTATAADFAALKAAGLSDSQLLSADASGKYRLELLRVAAASFDVARANQLLVATDDQVTEAQKAATVAQQTYTSALDQLNPRQARATALADGLRKVTQSLYGTQIAGADANEAYQASWDGLSASVKTNKDTLNIHTGAGRANRDALEAVIGSTNDLYYAELNTGSSIADATKKHEARIKAIKEEARRLGLNKTATQQLIDTYGQIPKKKQTDLVVTSVDKVAAALRDLYVFQRSLADGIPIASEIAKLKGEKGPAKKYGGYRDGGRTPAIGEHEVAGFVHGKEMVLDAPTVRNVDRQHPGFLDEVHATGGLPGYAGGGRVAPVDTSTRWPFRTTAANTRIPSRAQVTAKVTPMFAAGDWPSSPAAQRGDSGVWRKVVALIKSTGPVSGSFGNAYRPGDPLWHGSGRAVDWMGYNQDALATFLSKRNPLELIHRTPQRDYAYTRGKNKGSFNNALMEAHRNHVHIAMANGGVIGEPVAGVGLNSGKSYSFGENGPETVTPGVGGSGDVHFHFHDSVIVSKQHAEDLVVAGYTAAKKRKRL
jgi:hypothetical protein